jgi:hypothetical protein
MAFLAESRGTPSIKPCDGRYAMHEPGLGAQRRCMRCRKQQPRAEVLSRASEKSHPKSKNISRLPGGPFRSLVSAHFFKWRHTYFVFFVIDSVVTARANSARTVSKWIGRAESGRTTGIARPSAAHGHAALSVVTFWLGRSRRGTHEEPAPQGPWLFRACSGDFLGASD